MSKTQHTPLIVLLVCLFSCLPRLYAQTPTPPTEIAPVLVRVFLDCQYECDRDFIKQTITFVDYVRDRSVSDLHVLVTTQETGGGGTSWVLNFIGLGFFQGQNRILTFNTSGDATGDDRRKEFARVLRVGLGGYAASTSVAGELDVVFNRVIAANKTVPLKDKWNYWVFSLGASGYISGELTGNNQSHFFNVSASRTTEDWKINLSTYMNSNSSTFKFSPTESYKNVSDSWGVNSLVVKSLGPQWSGGERSSISHSSYSNIDRSLNIAPAIEYDFFPYSVSTRKSLTVQYAVGATKYQYREITVYDKLEETIPSHSVNTSLGVRAPWGSMNGSAILSQNLNNRKQYHITFNAGTNVRLFKGFSFNVSGGYSRIRDQIGLPKAQASTEEILLRSQQRATGYSYNMNFGVNYSFGSIFNSVVNPRFNGNSFFF